MEELNDVALTKVASYFRALSEPMRLRILNCLRDGEKSVRQLTELSGGGQANVSKHLSLLLEAGLVTREQRGTMAIYQIADACTYELCDLVCGNVAKILQRDAELHQAIQEATRRIG